MTVDLLYAVGSLATFTFLPSAPESHLHRLELTRPGQSSAGGWPFFVSGPLFHCLPFPSTAAKVNRPNKIKASGDIHAGDDPDTHRIGIAVVGGGAGGSAGGGAAIFG